MIELKMLTTREDLRKVTELPEDNHDKALWDAGFNLDDWDVCFVSDEPLTFPEEGDGEIGDYVRIAPGCLLTTIGHAIGDICIEDHVWLGGNVTVLPGVTIGVRSIIGAGSIVTKDIPPDVIAYGNPCKVIRRITANRE